MDINLNEVRKDIELYFKGHLPQYTVWEIRRKSNHPDDYYLWMVSAKKSDGTYAVWSSWKQLTKSLNHGHYGLKRAEDCILESLKNIRILNNTLKYTNTRKMHNFKCLLWIQKKQQEITAKHRIGS